jgi:hypothetical protein
MAMALMILFRTLKTFRISVLSLTCLEKGLLIEYLERVSSNAIFFRCQA